MQVYLGVIIRGTFEAGFHADCGSTWRGESGEEWSSAQGLESILISIQSLMSSNPYENEPGFETAHDEGDKKNQKDYVAKVGVEDKYRALLLLKSRLIVVRFVTKPCELALFRDWRNILASHQLGR